MKGVTNTVEVKTHDKDTVKYIEKKLADKGVHRMERHPSNGIGIRAQPHKSGHGGKYTWEGPGDVVENELCPSPAAIDEKDPNYVDDEAEKIVKDDLLVGEDEKDTNYVDDVGDKIVKDDGLVGQVEVTKANE